MLARGQVSRAVRRMTSHGIASFEEDWVKKALAAKYRERGRELPTSVTAGKCVESLPGLKDALLNLCPGVSPGFGGLRNEHLAVLADVWSEEELLVFHNFCMRYLQGTLQPWFYTVWGSVTTVPAFKSAERDSLRPLGIKSSLTRALHKEVVKCSRRPLTEYLEPQQLALSDAGGFKLVHSVRLMAEAMRGKRDWVVVKLDVANAHNEVSRAAVVEVLESVPELQHLAQHAATCLSGHQGLEVKGELWGRNGEGESQGDPEASPLFCVAWHPIVKELDSKLAAVGGKSLFGNDDGYLIGPASILFPALEQFSFQIRDRCLLRLQLSKTEVFSWESDLPAEVPEGMRRAGAMIDGRWESGFLCYGIAVGSDLYVQHQLDSKVLDITGEIRGVLEVLGPQKDYQAIWAVLNCSLAQKFDWQLSLNYPSDVVPAAARLDTQLWEMLEFATSQHIPYEDEGLGVECVLNAPGLPFSLQRRSFQQWLVRQPVRLRGLGLRSLVETRHAAFCGGVEMAVPRLTGDQGICPPLEHLVGVVDGPARWADFLEGGSRTAREFNSSWQELRGEVAGLCTMLGKDVTGPLAKPCVSSGEKGKSSRASITTLREDLRHEAMVKCLEVHQDRLARPVFVYQNLDKLSDPWVQALPGPKTGLSAAVFAEAMAARLCLHSPAVVASGKVGQPVARGGAIIDPFGDAINCCNALPGDTWRTRHDTCKVAIARECLASKLPHDVEVYGLFAHLLPAVLVEQGGDLQWARARQGLVPDFRIRLPTPQGPQDSLAELKVISAGVTWHPRGAPGTGVERRAATLAPHYRRELAKYDRRFHNTREGDVGPLVSLLQSFGKLEGLVVGPWGNGSSDLHSLVRILAESRVAHRVRGRGRVASENELGVVMGEVRRALSLDFVRAQAMCLLSRLTFLGEGARAAAGRRQQATRDEEERRRVQTAHYWAHVRGRGVPRGGEVYTLP